MNTHNTPASVSLTFLGASRNVTGSRYLLEIGAQRILVDCGLFQERAFVDRNWSSCPFPAASLNAVLLTHAHLDHCGWLPRLVREGFRGRIYCTATTSDVAQLLLMDSAHLQAEDAAFKRKRHQREGRASSFPEQALYNEMDVRACFKRLAPVRLGEPVDLGQGVTATFHEAGHILGAAMIRIAYPAGGAPRAIVFSGDIGRWDRPILHDPTVFDEADYVVMESTYGDRLHEGKDTIEETLTDVIVKTFAAGGNVLIPSFATERAQEVLYYLNQLLKAGRIPKSTVYLDSPMAAEVTRVLARHPELYDDEMRAQVEQGTSLFDMHDVRMVKTPEESKQINDRRESSIIIAGSGMCTGGRIKHHLRHNLDRTESAVLFVGYQAGGTLGRQLVDGQRSVRLFGQFMSVEARVLQMHGFSAHADRDELIRWISALRRPPRQVFVTHGEDLTAQAFARRVTELTGFPALAPEYRSTVTLS